MAVTLSVGITQQIYETVQLSVGITQEITTPTYVVRRWIKQQIYETVQLSVGITQEITQPTVQLSVGITQQVCESITLSVGITQHIYDVMDSPLWRSQVIIGGVDYSAMLIDTLSVEPEKDASTVAQFSMLPSAGAFNPLAWVGQVVTIDDVLVNASGIDVYTRRIFTGLIEKPTHIPDMGRVDFIASTVLQTRQNALTNEQIDEQIPDGYWSEHVFSEDSSGWQYTQDRLSTVMQAIWVDRMGRTRITDTETPDVMDYTITDDMRLADSVSIQRAEKSTIVNRVKVDIDFRYDRFKQRNIVVHWDLNMSLCEYRNKFPLPSRDMIRSAAEGSSWDLQGGISFKAAWPPQLVQCRRTSGGSLDIWYWGWDGGANGTHYTDGRSPTGSPDYATIATLCIGAGFTLGTRWAQTVTETYSMDIKSPASIAANGERAENEGYGIETESDDTAFETSKSYLATVTSSGDSTPHGRAGGSLAAMPAGTVVLPNGDYLFEATQEERNGRAALEHAQLTALHKGDTLIKKSHMQNRMSCVIPMQQSMALDLDLSGSLAIETVNDTGEGRIVTMRHERNINTGSALDTVEIAILQVGATGLDSATPLEAPAAPDVDPNTTVDQTGGIAYRSSGSTHVGGSVASPDYNPDWSGYVTNYFYDSDDTTPLSTDPNDPEAVYYPEGFYINTPEIGDADRQAIDAPVEKTYIVQLVEDTLEEAA